MKREKLHPAPDPISARLSSFALAHSSEMREAREKTAKMYAMPLESVGLVVQADGPSDALQLAVIYGLPAKDVLNIARKTGLEELSPEPGFWPVLIIDPVDTCLALVGDGDGYKAKGTA